jgi:hypothetical protein
LPKVLTPPTYQNVPGPLIFLAGPIQGAPDWHQDAVAILEAAPGPHLVASPKRATAEAEVFSDTDYRDQVAWEHFHLERAGENGVILFWLAREAKHQCCRAYAQTTRFELGEAVTLHRWKGIKVVVGIETDFSNARYLRLTIARKAPAIPLCSSLKQACETAIRLMA